VAHDSSQVGGDLRHGGKAGGRVRIMPDTAGTFPIPNG